MDAATAAQLVHGITYKPQWTIRARAMGSRGPTILGLAFVIDVRQSDVKRAPHYKQRIIIQKIFIIDVEPVPDALTLYHVVMRFIGLIEDHERREFFSVNGTEYHKPFHPHTHHGRAAWGTPDVDDAYDEA